MSAKRTQREEAQEEAQEEPARGAAEEALEDAVDPEAENEPQPQDAPPHDEPETPRHAAGYLALAIAATAVGTWLAFAPENAGTPAFLPPMALAYAPLVVVAVLRLRAQDRLREVLQPLRGDLGFGGLVAAALYGCAKVGQFALAGPGTPREAWIMHLSLFLGEPREDMERLLMGLSVLSIGAAEELVWRGLVQDSLFRALHTDRDARQRKLLAVGVTAAAFGLAHVTTMFRLAVPGVGLNPLLVLAGVGASAVWGWIAARNGRVAPSLFAHALFSWGVFEFPLWRL